ncbi:hypothetical protein GVAMD_0488 [Gardnerella vaginalis AMD]|nr:hypothetical protein GVAMD_0488 [Gardnerella vaginalis AMD]
MSLHGKSTGLSMQAQKRALIVRASWRFLTTFAVIVPGVC